jgi:uncharacterized membrane protein
MPKSTTEEKLAGFLGWFSLGLGTAQLVMPGALNRLAGIEDDAGARTWQRIVGARELAAFALIQADRPRPVLPVWARVGGDVKDLVLLSLAWKRKRQDTARLAMAIANIGAVTALDLYTAQRLSRSRGGGSEEEAAGEESEKGGSGPVHVKAAVTVRKPREEVERLWREQRAEDGAENGDRGRVRFLDAPGSRGTEVHVEFDYEPTAGKAGELMAKAIGQEPTQKTKDDLRRFKQALETGEVVRSEGSPEGTSALRHVKQRPAQPVAEGS